MLSCFQTRILSLSLVVESSKSTKLFTEEELQFVLYYLKYNINAQAPHFRQLTLSAMKKVRLTSIIYFWMHLNQILKLKSEYQTYR